VARLLLAGGDGDMITVDDDDAVDDGCGVPTALTNARVAIFNDLFDATGANDRGGVDAGIGTGTTGCNRLGSRTIPPLDGDADNDDCDEVA
jgi:hypothetical protein